jgi:predicted permease
MLSDLRLAVRQALRYPGHSALVLLTLALGLGVNASVFLFVSEFFLRPLPVEDPGRLVYVLQQSPRYGVPLGFSFPDYRDFADAAARRDAKATEVGSTFSGMLLYRQMPVALSGNGAMSERTWMAAVSANFFDVLGVRPGQGRLFNPDEGRQTGADPIVVLTHAYWQKRFGGDAGIIGQTISINSVACTVIGVTAPGFHGPQWTDALSGFVPLTLLPQLQPADRRRLENRGQLGNMMMGRLRPGATIDEARTAANVMLARLIERFPDEHAPARALVIPERLSRPSPAATGYTPLVVSALMLGALLVLAVAVANTTNLLFARALERQREIAVRSALGASRSRLVRQLVVESLLIALTAGILGLLLAQWAGDWLSRAVGQVSDTPPMAEHGVDWRLFAGTAALALLASVTAALVPALKATRHAVVPLLQSSGITMSAARQRLRHTLVVAEVALASVVLTVAGLGVRSARALARVNPGFEPDHLLLASYDLGLQGYVARNGLARAQQFHRTLLEQVRALPGVRRASLSAHIPFDIDGGGGNLQGSVVAEGAAPVNDPGAPLVPVVPVDHDYLRTMAIPLQRGRDFGPGDTDSAPRVAIINEAMAARLWPGESALGKRLVVGGRRPLEVIGVTANGRYLTLAESSRPHVFVPLAQNFRGKLTLVVRTDADPISLAPSLMRVGQRIEPDLPLYNLRTMDEQITQSPMGLMPVRFGAIMVGVQGALVLVLALGGIYGLVSFTVSRRTREIGVRMALGATAESVTRLVALEGVRLAFLGLIIGLPVALLATRPLGGLLFGVTPHDAVVFGVVAVLMLAIALAACLLPARRATHVNPVDALRAE